MVLKILFINIPQSTMCHQIKVRKVVQMSISFRQYLCLIGVITQRLTQMMPVIKNVIE